MNILKVPEILIPKKGVDLKKWAVIACDQFTSEPWYWDKLKNYCGEISTLNMILPEIYLSDHREERTQEINKTMQRYLDEDVFDTVNGFILTVRTTKYGNLRLGLMVAFDLEEYDIYEKKAVRATEATVKERLPVRVEIRKNAPIELPHSLVLIDDEKKSIIEPLYERRSQLKKLYSTELNMEGGTLEGYLVDKTDDIIKQFEELSSEANLIKKYGDKTPFLFAVGDGNHSVATAKLCWENLKPTLSEKERENHPARYCLVEVNNIYDDNLKFEPIYRVVFGAKEDFVLKMQKALSGKGLIKVYTKGQAFDINVPENTALAIKKIQEFIDDYIEKNSGVKQDYVHGTGNVLAIAEKNNGCAVLMPYLKKSDLFKYVALNGSLTRKSFSMGEAEEKRYYFECRKIR